MSTEPSFLWTIHNYVLSFLRNQESDAYKRRQYNKDCYIDCYI